MDDRTSTLTLEPKRRSCTDPFMLCQLREGQADKLGHEVEQILWVGENYAIYRTKQGVYLQFSDNEQEAREQRQRFTKICPELCELRYLTPQIRFVGPSIFRLREDGDGLSLFDHNIAQAMMLVMERDTETGQKIAQQALKMVIERVANDNTIRYVRASLFYWGVILFGALVVGAVGWFFSSLNGLGLYVIAGTAGATGAMLSIATRLQSFRLKPCSQSGMNYWMSAIRIGIGVIAGLILLLIAPTLLSDKMQELIPAGWQRAAVLGLIAGFADSPT
jgi:hypothetical protein